MSILDIMPHNGYYQLLILILLLQHCILGEKKIQAQQYILAVTAPICEYNVPLDKQKRKLILGALNSNTNSTDVLLDIIPVNGHY